MPADRAAAGDLHAEPVASDGEETAAILSSLQVRIVPDPVRFAETFHIVVTVVRPKGRAVGLPAVLPQTKTVRPVGSPSRSVRPHPSRGDGFVKETIKIPFVALDLEEAKTPAFIVTAPDGSAIDVPSLPVRIAAVDAEVASEEEEPTLASERTHHLYQVSDPRPWVGLSVFAFSLFLLAWVRFIESRRRFWFPVVVHVQKATQKARPAHEIALERLEALLAAGLLPKGLVALFVQRLMDEVLRDYLEARFAMPAGSRTTRELCQALLSLSAPGLDVAGVRRILEAADMVKFAKASLASEVAHQMAGDVRSLIDSTRQPDDANPRSKAKYSTAKPTKTRPSEAKPSEEAGTP